MKVDCPEGKETFNDEEMAEEAPSKGNCREVGNADAMPNWPALEILVQLI